MKLTVLIPGHNEQDSLPKTIADVDKVLRDNKIDFEILVVNDNSKDDTENVLKGLMDKFSCLWYINNPPPNGFGLAVRRGLAEMKGDAVCIVMADESDSPQDIVAYYRKLEEGYDCVFGSRFIKGAKVIDYPIHKLILNRMGNYFISMLLGIKHNDITNAFKCYKRAVIEGIEPLFSNHFNLTVEIPLKAVIRGFNFATIPISWTNRTEGVSKFRIKEMGSRYLFIIFYILAEKHLSRGDYLKKERYGKK